MKTSILPFLPVVLAALALMSSAAPQVEPVKIEMSEAHKALCMREGGCQIFTLEAVRRIEANAFAAGRRHEAGLQPKAQTTCGKYTL